MKTSFYLYMLCFCLSIFWMSCEKAPESNISNKSSSQTQLLPRDGGECDNCPVGDCCCAVWLQPTADLAKIRICGSSDGTPGCTKPAFGNCDAISGGAHSWTLINDEFEKAIFCMHQGDPFYISNWASSGIAYVIVSCQNGLTNPDTIWLQIEPTTGEYWQANGSCELVSCE